MTIRERLEPIITLSIEPTGGPAFIHGFHLGTDERVARQIAEETFHGRNKAGNWTCSVALIKDHKIIAVYDGNWSAPLKEPT